MARNHFKKSRQNPKIVLKRLHKILKLTNFSRLKKGLLNKLSACYFHLFKIYIYSAFFVIMLPHLLGYVLNFIDYNVRIILRYYTLFLFFRIKIMYWGNRVTTITNFSFGNKSVIVFSLFWCSVLLVTRFRFMLC